MAIDELDTLPILEINCETGEEVYRPLTEAEIAERVSARKQLAEMRAQQEAEAKAIADAKASAIAKLSALGLTAEEIAAL